MNNKNNNFIAFTNDDIIIYKYFLNFHKKSGIKFDEYIKNTSLNQNEIYKLSHDYCKDFKYNICLCNRIYYKNNLIDYNYNKRILYNINNFNNFNFTNPINFINNNEKIFRIDIFTFYRQEYIPFIINEEFIKSKKKKSNLNQFNNIRLSSLFIRFKENKKLAYHFRLSSLFIRFKENIYKDDKIILKYYFKLFYSFYIYNKLHNLYNDNTYYNELINIFDTKSFLLNNDNNDKLNDNNDNNNNDNNDNNDNYYYYHLFKIYNASPQL